MLEFGNSLLGAQFLTANPDAGLDWSVRRLATLGASGEVSVAWTDFTWIARRHCITDRRMQFDTAAGGVESISSQVKTQ